MNTASLEGKPQELALTGFNDATFIGIYDQLQTVLQVLADTVQHSFTGSLTFYYYRKVISVAGELVATFLKFFVQRVEHDVRQQWR